MAAAIFVCDHDNLDLSAFTVLLNWCNNTTACTWVNKNCKHGMIGRRRGRLLAGLLMRTKIGVQVEWISTYLIFIADDISHLKKESAEGDFDYRKLKESYPILDPCRQFQPSNTLLTVIWDVLLNKRFPDPLIVREFKLSALKQFIS